MKRWAFEFDERWAVLRVYRAEDGVADSMGPELASPAEVSEFVEDLRREATRCFGGGRVIEEHPNPKPRYVPFSEREFR